MSDRQNGFNVKNSRDVNGLVHRPSSLKLHRQNSGLMPVSYRNFAYLASTDSSEPKEPEPDLTDIKCDCLKGNLSTFKT